jgi:hypothetical protein
MPKLHISSRAIAAALLFLVGAISVGICAFVVWELGLGPLIDLSFVELAFSPDNEERGFFIVMLSAATFSIFAAFLLVFVKRPIIVKSVLVGAFVQFVAYAVVGAWFMVAFAAAPLWWLYGAMHEV